MLNKIDHKEVKENNNSNVNINDILQKLYNKKVSQFIPHVAKP